MGRSPHPGCLTEWGRLLPLDYAFFLLLAVENGDRNIPTREHQFGLDIIPIHELAITALAPDGANDETAVLRFLAIARIRVGADGLASGSECHRELNETDAGNLLARQFHAKPEAELLYNGLDLLHRFLATHPRFHELLRGVADEVAYRLDTRRFQNVRGPRGQLQLVHVSVQPVHLILCQYRHGRFLLLGSGKKGGEVLVLPLSA